MKTSQHPISAWLVAAGVSRCSPAASRTAPSDTVRVSGHVEATEVQVAAEVGGRLVDLRVAEGDRVTRRRS